MVEHAHTAGNRPRISEPLRSLSARIADWFAPASEAGATDQAYQIAVELPGVAVDAVDISLTDGMLTLKGEKTSSREERGETWFFSEREYGAFSRSFRLPPDADPAKIDAEMKDGVLRISIAKRGEDEKSAQKIKVKHG